MGACFGRLCGNQHKERSRYKFFSKKKCFNKHQRLDFDPMLIDEDHPRQASRTGSWISGLHRKRSLPLDEEEDLQMLNLTPPEVFNPARLAFITPRHLDSGVWRTSQEDSQNNNNATPRRCVTLGSSTPNSSLDLEWENELGIVVCHPMPPEDDEPPSDSHPSTPVSNGNDLEWDFGSGSDTRQLLLGADLITRVYQHRR